MAVDNQEIELHADFFNHEISLVQNLTLEQIDAEIKELEKVVFEAKARLSAATSHKRERIAKLSKEEREKLINDPSFDALGSDGLIKKRMERISKADKLKNQLTDLIPADMLADLMRNITVNATDDTIKKANVKPENRATFNSPSTKEEQKEEVKKETKPDNLADSISNLFG